MEVPAGVAPFWCALMRPHGRPPVPAGMPPPREDITQLEDTRTWECHPRSWAGPSLRSAVAAGDGEPWSLSSDLKRAVLGREGRLLCVFKKDVARTNVSQSVAKDERIKAVPGGRLCGDKLYICLSNLRRERIWPACFLSLFMPYIFLWSVLNCLHGTVYAVYG